jgi:hypothetical protein
MADLPILQKGTAGAQIQAAGVVGDHNGFLVPPLPVFVEHLQHV